MREIVSVADDLDVGGILEGISMHIAPLRDAHFGEAGATRESVTILIFLYLCHRWGDGDVRETGATFESLESNLRHRWWYGDAREAGATRESTVPNLRHR